MGIYPNSVDPIMAQAAIATHDLLTRARIDHVFMGGFQLALLGSSRKPTSLDIEVIKPTFGNGFEKVFKAFQADASFTPIEGSRTDAIRVLWARSVGIDIFMRDGRFPKSGFIDLPVAPSNPQQISVPRYIPCLKLHYLLVEKVRSAGERYRDIDFVDIRFMVYTLAQSAGAIDLKKVRKKLTDEEVQAALLNHSNLAQVFKDIELV